MAKAARSRTTTTRKRNHPDILATKPEESKAEVNATAQPAETLVSAPISAAEETNPPSGPEVNVEAEPAPHVASQQEPPYPPEALFFDSSWYLAAYPDVGACGMDAVEHFMTHGYLEGRDPNGHFSVAEYIAANPDIPLTINPFLHFIMHGAAEGRRLHP